MTTYLPDTNILISALNNKRGRRELLMEILNHGHRLACCTVVISELFSGIQPPDVVRIEQFVSLLVWYPASPSIARRAGRWRFDWARRGITLSLADTLIAATAVEHGLMLITDNNRHFPMPELSIHLCQ